MLLLNYDKKSGLFLLYVFLLLLFFFQIFIRQNNQFTDVSVASFTKLRSLSDVHLILLGAVENDFQLVTQKENYEIAGGL